VKRGARKRPMKNQIELSSRRSSLRLCWRMQKVFFPRWGREVVVEEKWQWGVYGGLIGGKGSNWFCIKRLTGRGLMHCGTGLQAFKKADLREGFGYIPSTGDITNTRSAILFPSADAGSLREAYMESLRNCCHPSSGCPILRCSLLRMRWVSSLKTPKKQQL
jgi:hypothetical protein